MSIQWEPWGIKSDMFPYLQISIFKSELYSMQIAFWFHSETKSSDTSKVWSNIVLVPQRVVSNFKSPIPKQLNTSDFTLKVLTLYNFLRTMIKARLQSITFNHILQKHWPQLRAESILVWAAKSSSTLLVLFRSLNRKLWTAKTRREIELGLNADAANMDHPR